MDVIGTPEREPRDLPSWLGLHTGLLVVAGTVVVAGLVVVAGAAAFTAAPMPADDTSPADGTSPARAPAPDAGLPDLGIRGVGGASSVVRVGIAVGAQGRLEMEVRNGSRTVRLAGLTAEVPGVRFVPRTPPNGATLPQDGLIRLELGYVIEDCARLKPEGQIIFTLLEPEGPLDVVVPLLDDGGDRQQSALDRVLDACPE